MCGIAGLFNLTGRDPIDERDLRQMLGMIRHRGPDQFGIYLDRQIGLGNARLSIIDLSTGQQPIGNEDGSMWIVFNGEIFNYIELRRDLEARGHLLATTSDTEVLLHAFEEFGPGCLERLNGQFAVAIWDARNQSLFLARDRLGVRPLFYTLQGGRLLFASEIKAILSDRRISAELDPAVLVEVFTYWGPLTPHTVFKGIAEVPPGHYLLANGAQVKVHRYWDLYFPCRREEPTGEGVKDLSDYEAELTQLLIDAVRLRLRADVSVGAYLSGGLDSSIIAALIRKFTTNHLDTFSIAFEDSRFDESSWQREMAQFLGTNHQVVHASYEDIGAVFPEVIWHAETPLMRTAPAPMFLLSKLVRNSGYKVVLTGEGADEFLAGYDIFKEAKIRRFWATQPGSTWRPALLRRLYPDVEGLHRTNLSFLAAFFQRDLLEVNSPAYSHVIRWRNGRRNCRFFNDDAGLAAGDHDRFSAVERLPAGFELWEPLARAQYLEIKTFLSQYLLSSQGDRMAMAHSVEGRFPFLDYRVVEFCTALPARLKLRALKEKFLLKRLAKRWLPGKICQRLKRPYRAPIRGSFFCGQGAEGLLEMLSSERVQQAGLFKPALVRNLVAKARCDRLFGENDEMALTGIISAQLLYSQFVSDFHRAPPIGGTDDVKVCAPIHATALTTHA